MADERRESPITIMVEPSLRERFEAAAVQQDRSLSWCGKAAIEAWLEENEKGRKK